MYAIVINPPMDVVCAAALLPGRPILARRLPSYTHRYSTVEAPTFLPASLMCCQGPSAATIYFDEIAAAGNGNQRSGPKIRCRFLPTLRTHRNRFAAAPGVRPDRRPAEPAARQAT